MASLRSCDSCAGFLPPTASACPHCGAAARTPRKALGAAGSLLGAACSGAVALTLMACYGGPPGEPPICPDRDGDGHYDRSCPTKEPLDCNDNDPAIHPGAEDPDGDGVDQNCDGADGIASVVRGESAAPGDPAPTPSADAEAAAASVTGSTTAASSGADAAAPPPARE